MSASEVLHLVTLFNTSLGAMEKRLGDKMDENSAAAKDRWTVHDKQLAENTLRVITRFELVEASQKATNATLLEHLDRERIEEERTDARVRPVKIGMAWVVANWRTVALFLFVMLGWFAVTADLVARYLGIET